MENYHFLQASLALLFISCLIYSALLVLRKFFPYYVNNIKVANTKLKIEEQIFLSSKQKVVIVSYNNLKYILLLGNTEVVIDKVNNPDIVDAIK